MAKKTEYGIIVPDTSVLISGKVSELIEKKEIGGEIIILEAVISELENQANRGRQIGFEGLEEITKLKGFDSKKKIKLTYYGSRPTPEEIKAAKFGAIDAKIREAATKKKALLLTGDYVQYTAAKARGIKCRHIELKEQGTPGIEGFFDKDTMSVHLKLGVVPLAKKGRPGNLKLVKLGEAATEEDEMNQLIKEIIDFGRENRCIEMNMNGATVVQIGKYRIAIAQPPFASAPEITAVRPVTEVTLEDYTLSDKLRERLVDRAEGVFICGPPGAGKSSFAAALANFYMEEKNAIVKTMESPRDLQVNKEITQYAPLEGSMAKTSDVLLLVRPDYTIYDEVRKGQDFNIFADMRLAGVGMIGVTHAASPLDAIQRIISRIDLGQIPYIVDTIVFIKDAEIRKVYETKMTVKVPVGMVESDLARPVVEVRDFETGQVEHEIYTFGEQTIIMDAKKAPKQIIGEIFVKKSEYIIEFPKDYKNKDINLYAGDYYLLKAHLDRDAVIRLPKKGKLGRKIERAMKYGDKIKGMLIR